MRISMLCRKQSGYARKGELDVSEVVSFTPTLVGRDVFCRDLMDLAGELAVIELAAAAGMARFGDWGGSTSNSLADLTDM